MTEKDLGFKMKSRRSLKYFKGRRMELTTKIPDEMLCLWQELIDIVAKIAEVPSALIMRVYPDDQWIEVFASSHTENNPYEAGEKARYYFRCGLYCEYVIRTQKKLQVVNALQDSDWDQNPDIELGMISYFGFPVNFPDGSPFGTICILDSSPHRFNQEVEEMMTSFKIIIEKNLELIYEIELNERIRMDLEHKYEQKLIDILNINRALDVEKKFISKVMQISPTGILLFDKEGESIFCNTMAKDLIGIRSGHHVGETEICKSCKKKNQNGLLFPQGCRIFHQVKQRKEPLVGHITRFQEDGEPQKVLSANATPLFDENGSFEGVVIIVSDLTRLHHMEKQNSELQENFIQSQKMEVVGKLAGGIAHDLNNMLTPVIGYTEMLLLEMEEFGKLSGLSDQESLQEILNAAKDAKHLISQLLTFSRKQNMKLKKISLNQVIRSFEKLLRKTVRDNIRIELKLSDSLQDSLLDEGQMKQLILNLVVNAQDAIEGEGVIEIETCLVKSSDYPDSGLRTDGFDQMNLLLVKDNGSGIDPEHQSRIFEPFFTTKDECKGTGLGLSTVYGIVQQHRGNIFVESRPNLGTVFGIFFPPYGSSSQEALGSSDSVKPQNFNKKTEKDEMSARILILDDDESTARMLKTILRSLGNEVCTANNSSQAFLKAEEFKPEILLSDCILPTSSGMEAWEKMRQKLPDLKIIFMSGYPQQEALQKLKGSEKVNVNFIQKPFSTFELLYLLKEVMKKENAPAQSEG